MNLKGSYGLRGKVEGLLVVKRLMGVVGGDGGREALKRLLGKSSVGGIVLGDGSGLRGDYEGVFERGLGIREEEMAILHRFRDDDASIDPVSHTLPDPSQSLIWMVVRYREWNHYLTSSHQYRLICFCKH